MMLSAVLEGLLSASAISQVLGFGDLLDLGGLISTELGVEGYGEAFSA
ncbi:hypothetical protein H2C43_07105 [Corynebacterium glutamicum]|nr:hypothetical protein [Corynebacterium glutamicum]MBA4571775.1 hypothetical protein [Corynebacterium glutamicum]MBA4574710.1 hypothetical protein [Corynebacterium glutamicum]MBA4577639.1 hypothetical protein [Corynebacterium glutamicum]MBA4579619.1 hypothetical protein [Corynebacterium glutamicum]MBA4583486.1 hypothetical protein [Corynebacterium glutamicum]